MLQFETNVKVHEAVGISLLLLAIFTPLATSAILHQECSQSSDCEIEHSHCDGKLQKCVCLPTPYAVEINSTSCLPGTLLGFECQFDIQCSVKVPTSGCVNEVCQCSDGFVAYRRNACLPPAQFGEMCFSNEQCSLADPGSTCKFIVPRFFGRCQCQSGKRMDAFTRKCQAKEMKIGNPCKSDADCLVPNSYCNPSSLKGNVCTCDLAFSPSQDEKRCLPTYRGLLSPTTLGYPCDTDLQCQLADPNSFCKGGFCDCTASNSTNKCNAKKTGCRKGTFQCHGESTCISWYFVCDGKKDCSDGSDEICQGAEQCPPQAFQCSESESEGESSRKCISRGKLCDGIPDCKNGEDEKGCSGPRCPPGTFQCATSKECLPEHYFCNSIADCKDLSDESERLCRQEFQPSEFCPFRCSNGLCRSSAIVCSGVNGCGDFSDEEGCKVCRCPRLP